jgi:hypothetical protein
MAVAMTDAIPLLADDGVTGRNNARDFRVQLLGRLLLPDGSVGVRPGVLSRQYIGGAFVDLKAIQLNTPGQAVQMYPGSCVVNRTGQGPYLLTAESTLANVPLPAAHATQNRYDVVFVRLYDKAIGDSGAGPHGPYVDVLSGVETGTPVIPSVASIDGALPIAAIYRAANDNTITESEITDLRRGTAWLGTPRIMLPGDNLADPGLFVSERRLRMAVGSDPFVEEIWGADGKWYPVKSGTLVGWNERNTTVSTTATTAATAFRIMTATAPVKAGRTYEVGFKGEMRNTVAPCTAEIDVRYTTNGTEPTVSSAQMFREIVRLDGVSIPESVNGSKHYPATADGELRVTLAMFAATGGGTLTYDSSASAPGEITITDKGPTVAKTGTVY